MLEIIGDVKGKNCLIVDDFTISGGTLVNLADALKKHGCKRVYALLSHNIISARGVAKIDASPIEAVFSTDTVDNPNIIGHPKFKTISVAPMFAETIMRFYNYESISSMFAPAGLLSGPKILNTVRMPSSFRIGATYFIAT